LSSPTATKTGAVSATGTVSTDEGAGTLYTLVSTSNTIIDDSDDGFWDASGKQEQPVSASGLQNIAMFGLTPSTTYTVYYGQTDSAGNRSNVVRSLEFTTDAAPPSTGSKQLNISLRIGFGL